jgi:hypothetical protein
MYGSCQKIQNFLWYDVEYIIIGSKWHANHGISHQLKGGFFLNENKACSDFVRVSISVGLVYIGCTQISTWVSI